ncbi:hypothetical protein [Burkholderia sp. BCC0044]|uniref:hypothetical protein n=1 Tax=Burkholderia sp. BCC0044 TaxID=2676295 RepID=UPI00158E0004|nr:hypothetical protein [Burkholderia sp. BCC0044]
MWATDTNAGLLFTAASQIRLNGAVNLTGRNAHLEFNAKNGDVLGNDQTAVTLSGDNAPFRSNGEDYTVLHTVADRRSVDANLNGRHVPGNRWPGRLQCGTGHR